MKIIIEVERGIVSAVYADDENIDIIINDLDCMEDNECESIEGMKQVY